MRLMDAVWVGVGGFVGSVLRYAVGTMCLAWTDSSGFPVGTLVVNCAGCFLMGCLQGAALRSGFSKELMLLLSVGVLGGFTTLSALGWEWMKLVQMNRYGMAMMYVLVTLGLGFSLLAVGMMLGGRIASPR